MKICYIANTAYNFHFARWYSYFLNRGHDVYVISGDNSRTDIVELPGIKVFYLPEKKFKSHFVNFGYNFLKIPQILTELKKIIRDISPDIIHAHQVYPEGFWASLINFHPYVVTPAGSDLLIYAPKHPLYRFISKFVLKTADLITCDSIVLKNNILKFGGKPDKTHLIFNGVEFEMFSPDIDKTRIRERYSIGNSPLILSVRSLAPIYNIDYVVRVIPKVLQFFSDAKFLFCYVPTDRAELNIKNLIHELGIEKAVKLAGMVSRKELPFYYASADICVSVPSSDSSPSSVYEAMACGCPVVVSDLPWTRHFIHDGENALAVPPKNSEVISNAILKILNNHALKKKIGEGGKSTIKHYADYNKNMEMMEFLMKDMVAERL